MARRALTQANPEPERRAAGKAAFQKMSRGVRVLSRLSLPPDLLEKLSPRSHPERDEVPDMVFYTGCNMLKTPHIGLLCLDVIEALGVTYEVQGGPSACCGILPSRPGDTPLGGHGRRSARWTGWRLPKPARSCPGARPARSSSAKP